MGVYRGPGGTGESSSNTAVTEIVALSNTVIQAKADSEASASSAAASATAAAASASSIEGDVVAAEAAKVAAEAAQEGAEEAQDAALAAQVAAEAAQAASEAAEDALVNVYTKTEVDSSLATKQATLVSGTNIKTVNSGSLLGSGDLVIEGVSSGSIIYFARNTAPTGYLKANGAAVSRTAYAALFAAIGTTFGAGDGSTTFLLPDLRGEFIRGWADGRAVDTGRAFGSFQDQAFASHSHSATSDSQGNHNHGYSRFTNVGYNSGKWTLGGPGLDAWDTQGAGTDAAGTHSHNISVGNTGGTETRPRNVALLACIKF